MSNIGPYHVKRGVITCLLTSQLEKINVITQHQKRSEQCWKKPKIHQLEASVESERNVQYWSISCQNMSINMHIHLKSRKS